MKIDTGSHTAAMVSAAPRAGAPEAIAQTGQGNGKGEAPVAARAQDEFITAAKALRDALGPMFQTEPRFRVDPSTNRVQVEIIDQETGDVVREIPSDTLVRFAHTFDILLGLNIDETV